VGAFGSEKRNTIMRRPDMNNRLSCLGYYEPLPDEIKRSLDAKLLPSLEAPMKGTRKQAKSCPFLSLITLSDFQRIKRTLLKPNVIALQQCVEL
jgi:hypothetical protein